MLQSQLVPFSVLVPLFLVWTSLEFFSGAVACMCCLVSTHECDVWVVCLAGSSFGWHVRAWLDLC